MKRILVCSAAGLTEDGNLLNVGDEALTEVLVEAIRSRLPSAEVRATLHTSGQGRPTLPSGRVPIRPIRALDREIRQADLVIAGGGTLIQEDVRPRFYEPAAGLLRFIGAVATLARARGKPFMLAGVGAEHLSTSRSRMAARHICRSAISVTTRDRDSAELLRAVARCNPIVSADPMFLNWVPDGAAGGGGGVFVNLRADASQTVVEEVAHFLREFLRHHQISLVPMDRRQVAAGDGHALARLQDVVGVERCRLLDRLSWRQLLQEMRAADMCIGMRLHFMIFASIAERPLVALTTSSKSQSLVHDLHLTHVAQDSRSNLQAALHNARPASNEQLQMLARRADILVDEVERLCA